MSAHTTGLALSLTDIRKSFGDLDVLRGMSFTVHPGEIYGFVGANGSGKTTAMRIALGVATADSGEVTLGGQPIDLDLRRAIGYMPEERGLYSKDPIGAQIAYLGTLHGLSPAEAKSSATAILEELGLGERLTDRLESLSLGNQQRVQLAAALVHNPQVLVLDEPFSGLDPVAVGVMSRTLRDYANRGCPVVFSSHQLDLVERLCDRVGIVRDGRIAIEGTVEELATRHGISYRIGCAPTPELDAGIAAHPAVRDLRPAEDGSGILITCDADTDAEQQHRIAAELLDLARAAGPVWEFGRVHIPLNDLFSDAITQEA